MRRSVDAQARIVIGSIVLLSVVLQLLHDNRWWLLTAGMGLGLIGTGILNRCGTKAILDRMPWNR